MHRFILALLPMALLAGCQSSASPGAPVSPTPSTASPAALPPLKLTGSFTAEFPARSSCLLTTAVSAGKSSPNLVFTGGHASAGGGYQEFFSIFPFNGPATYAKLVSSGAGSSVGIAAVPAGPNSKTWGASSGKIVVDRIDAISASGSLDVDLVATNKGATAAPLHLAGQWACSITKPTTINVTAPSASPHP